MAKKSAGILLYRFNQQGPEFFIVHPGGPYWENKDEGAWSIPKGEFTDEEDPLHAALREFQEETGYEISGEFITLSPVRQSSGKWIYPFAQERDFNPSKLISNTFEMEWPPHSGELLEIPEIDRGEWVDFHMSKIKLNPHQTPIIDELIEILKNQHAFKQDQENLK